MSQNLGVALDLDPVAGKVSAKIALAIFCLQESPAILHSLTI